MLDDARDATLGRMHAPEFFWNFNLVSRRAYMYVRYSYVYNALSYVYVLLNVANINYLNMNSCQCQYVWGMSSEWEEDGRYRMLILCLCKLVWEFALAK